jgi:hypothetical protein
MRTYHLSNFGFKFIFILIAILFCQFNALLGRINFKPYSIMYTVNTWSNVYCFSQDFDNDSLNDLVVLMCDTDTYFVEYKQVNGSLVFYDSVVTYPRWGNPSGISSGDLNGDGLCDIVFGMNDSVAIYYQDSIHGFFNSNNFIKFSENRGLIHGVAVGDLNNDSLDDIAIAYWNDTSISVYYQEPNHSFSEKSYYKTVSSDNELKISDINNDGLNDLVLTNGNYLSSWIPGANSYSFAIYLQDSISNFLKAALEYGYNNHDPMYMAAEGLDVGDLNGDGLKDIVTCNNDSIYIWYQDTLNPVFFSQPNVVIYSADNCQNVDIADFNNDRYKEIMVTSSGGIGIRIFQCDNNYNYGNFVAYSGWSLYCDQPSKRSISDINNDGYLDVITTFPTGVSLLYNNTLVSVNEISSSIHPINVFPNPVISGEINIQTDDFKNSTWSIYDLMGRELESGKIEAAWDKIYFKDNIKSSDFILKINFPDGLFVSKLFCVIK